MPLGLLKTKVTGCLRLKYRMGEVSVTRTGEGFSDCAEASGGRSSETPRLCHLSSIAVRDRETGVLGAAYRSPPARGPGHLGDVEASQAALLLPGQGSFI